MFVVTGPTWKALSPHGSQSNGISNLFPLSEVGRCQLRNHVSAAGLVARRKCTGSSGRREAQRCRHRISREAVQLDDRISETVHCDDSHVRATVDVKAILSDPGIEGNPLEFLKVTEAYWKVWSSSPALLTIKTLCTAANSPSNPYTHQCIHTFSTYTSFAKIVLSLRRCIALPFIRNLDSPHFTV